MQSRIRAKEFIRSKMEQLRLIRDTEIPSQQQKMEACLHSFLKSLESAKAISKQTVLNQEKIGKLKAQLREAEDDLVKALAVKTRKEAKRMVTVDSVAATKLKIEELKRIVEDKRAKMDEYATIKSQQTEALASCEEKRNKDAECRGDIEEAILWYNSVLGFRIECGHAVKFIFTKINPKNHEEEYSFSIRHENDIYTLLNCDPQLNDTKDLIHELNRSNGLFKFVKIMREKFQKAALCGTVYHATPLDLDSSTISASGPISSVSTGSITEYSGRQQDLESGETYILSRKVLHARGSELALRSPGSSSSHRRSPRTKVKK